MSLRANIELFGLKELRGRLDPHRLRAVLVAALEEGLGPIAASVGFAAPVGKTGKLAKSIKVRVADRGGASLTGTIRSNNYGHLVNEGHRIVVGGRTKRANAPIDRLTGRKLKLFTGGRVASSGYAGRVVGFVKPKPFVAGPFASLEGFLMQTVETRFREFLVSERVT